MKKDPNIYPPGLNAKKVRQIIDFYENPSDEDAAIEIATAPSGKRDHLDCSPRKVGSQDLKADCKGSVTSGARME